MKTNFLPDVSIRMPVLVLFTIFSLILAGCDGGISGTGGPDTQIMMPINGTDSEISAGESDTDPAPVGAPQVLPDAEDTSFVNNANVTLRTDAIVNLVNSLSGNADALVVTNNSNTINPILPLPGLSFSDQSAGYFTLLADTHDIDIVLATDYAQDINAEKIAGVNPMTLAAGSSSTIIVRGVPGAETTPAQALVIANHTSTNSLNTVEFRVVNAAAQFAMQGNLDIYVLPAGQLPTQNDMPAFKDFSYATGVTDWIEVPAGSWDIVATDAGGLTQRFATAEPLVPAASGSWTIVVRDDPSGVAGVDTELVILNDGDTGALQ